MFRLLKVTVSGYRLLRNGFSFSFIPKSKVMSEDLSHQVYEIDRQLYFFHSLAVVGPNSSGKSTLISLLLSCFGFLSTGRFAYYAFDFSKDEIDLKLDFYLGGNVYFYAVKLLRPDLSDASGRSYCFISNESIKVLKYSYSMGRNVLEKEDMASDVTAGLLSKSLKDTSAIGELFKKPISFDYFATNAVMSNTGGLVSMSVYNLLRSTDPRIVAPVVTLLDDSIDAIEPLDGERVIIRRHGQRPVEGAVGILLAYLSTGTIRGIELFIRAYRALSRGSILLVDEIESSFHKDIVKNLIMLFNDSSSNPNNATLLFSTHFTEALDLLSRLDSIYITHREGDSISMSNLKGDHNVRAGLLASRQLDSGSFGNSPDYERLMNVIDAFKDGLSPKPQ